MGFWPLGSAESHKRRPPRNYHHHHHRWSHIFPHQRSREEEKSESAHGGKYGSVRKYGEGEIAVDRNQTEGHATCIFNIQPEWFNIKFNTFRTDCRLIIFNAEFMANYGLIWNHHTNQKTEPKLCTTQCIVSILCAGLGQWWEWIWGKLQRLDQQSIIRNLPNSLLSTAGRLSILHGGPVAQPPTTWLASLILLVSFSIIVPEVAIFFSTNHQELSAGGAHRVWIPSWRSKPAPSLTGCCLHLSQLQTGQP